MNVEQLTKIERFLLGSIMADPDVLEECITFVRGPEVFCDSRHKSIFKSIINLYDLGYKFDRVSVLDRLIKISELESSGGESYLDEIQENITGTINSRAYAIILAEHFIKRSASETGYRIQIGSKSPDVDPFNLVEKGIRDLESITGGFIQDTTKRADEVAHSVMVDLESKIELRRKAEELGEDFITGISGGFRVIAELTGGFQKPELTILGARPAMGKTAFALIVALNVAAQGHPAYFFSLEMSKSQLLSRLISAISGVDNKKIRMANLSKDELDKCHSATDFINGIPLFIEDQPAISLREMRTKTRKWYRKESRKNKKTPMIFLDYLQLMSGSGTSNRNRENEISEISRGIKELTKEIDCPILALSQLSRKIEERSNKMPILSDLRESGSIEQDADNVWFLMRPEYYGESYIEKAYKSELNQMATIFGGHAHSMIANMGFLGIAKARHGSLHEIPLHWIGKYTKYKDIEDGRLYRIFGIEQESYE